MIKYFFTKLRELHADIRQTEHIYMVLAALLIGLLGGFSAVGFRKLISLGQDIFWWQSDYTLEYIRSLPWLWKVSIPAVGGFIVGLIVYYLAREAKGHGVPEVMEAVSLRGGRIRPRVVIAKMFASAVCIASGGSVGREGPIVQIGSTIGSSLGQYLKIDERRLRTLVGCGAAAGIAATFNAPVAGALFAVEIILGDFGVSQFSPIVISSVAATVISRLFFGDSPAFAVPSYSLINVFELVIYAFLGICAGLASILFIKALYGLEDIFDKIKLYFPLKTAFGGLIIGLIALKFPEIFGVGYETINSALHADMVWWLLLTLMLAKILAVSITIGSGGSGGIFAPSLFIGAMMGGAIGTAANLIWPGSVANPGAYALVGMGAVVAGATHAPITAILIIFELTSDYKIILPLMISCIIATILAGRLNKASIYSLKLLRRGIDIHEGQSPNVLKNIKVSQIMRFTIVKVNANTQLMSIISKFIEYPGKSIFVTDEENHLQGVITLDKIRPIISDSQGLSGLIIAQDLMICEDYPTFNSNDSLAEVMKQLGSYSSEAPVIENGKIVGSIWPEDVIMKYNAEIFKRDMAMGMASNITSQQQIESLPGIGDLAVAEIPVPSNFNSKSIAELNIRKEFDATILMIKHKENGQNIITESIPSADTILHFGDIMLAMGSKISLTKLRRGR